VRTIAEACGLQPPAIEALDARVSAAAAKGYRTLAVARGPEKSAPVLVGLVSLYDPPRPDAKQLIATLHDLGVPVKMLTGDALPVALEIGQGVGLPNIKRMADLKTASAQADFRRSAGQCAPGGRSRRGHNASPTGRGIAAGRDRAGIDRPGNACRCRPHRPRNVGHAKHE
jgi:magnesium-transporting ATPase (P-type)